MFNNHARILLVLLMLMATTPAWSQRSATPGSHEVDLALTYNAVRQNATPGQTFWQQGGALDLSAEAYRGLGAAMRISGDATQNANNSGVSVKAVNVLFGPRYTYCRPRLSVFGEGLIGESLGFGGIYPSPGGALGAYDSFALQVGGGVDVPLNRLLAIRPVEASWLRTQFPNSTTNVQNGPQIGAGVVLRLQR